MTEPSTSDAGAGAQRQSAWARRALPAVAAGLLQAVVAYMTAIMGLGWGGFTYTAATSQSLLAFVAIAVLIRRPPWPLVVPLLSAVLTGALLLVGGQLGHSGA